MDQKREDLILESYHIAKAIQNQFEDKRKVVDQMHLKHDAIRMFQNAVQKLLHDQRDTFYKLLRDMEHKSPQLIEEFFTAVRNNQIGMV